MKTIFHWTNIFKGSVLWLIIVVTSTGTINYLFSPTGSSLNIIIGMAIGSISYLIVDSIWEFYHFE